MSGSGHLLDERTRRLAANEAIFREVNERIEQLNRAFAAAGEVALEIVCECGEMACTTRLSVPTATYERVRADAALFFVIPGHEDLGLEDVVEPGETSFTVVRKHAGPARAIANATDPRAA